MSSIWIAMKHNLITKPRFRRLHRATGAESQSTTIGRLVLVWWMADQHSVDGTMFGSYEDVDDAADYDGFAKAMEAVGWLTCEGDEITFVDFGDHNGKTAKGRMVDQKRTRDKRRSEPKNASVSETVGHEPDKCPKKQDHRTEQNRTEQNKKSKSGDKSPSFDWDKDCPPSMNTPEIREAYAEWASYRREAKYRAWKPVTIRKALRQFDGLSAGAFPDAVNHSIKQGYQGLFPPKDSATKVRPNDQNTCGNEDILAKLREQSI